MKIKKKKYFSDCDNPNLSKMVKFGNNTTFESLPILLHRDYSKNSVFHILSKSTINIYNYPDGGNNDIFGFLFTEKI